jgi:hypothetical protein
MPTYTWNKDANSKWYWLYVNDSTGNRVSTWYSAAQAGCSGSTGTCSVTPSSPLEEGPYKWWIDGWNPNGPGSWSNGMAFTVSVGSGATE